MNTVEFLTKLPSLLQPPAKTVVNISGCFPIQVDRQETHP